MEQRSIWSNGYKAGIPGAGLYYPGDWNLSIEELGANRYPVHFSDRTP